MMNSSSKSQGRSFSFKFEHNKEVRRLNMAFDDDRVSFTKLMDVTTKLFPAIKEQGRDVQITLTWVDDEGDEISISSSEELTLALDSISQSVKKFSIKVEAGKKRVGSRPSSPLRAVPVVASDFKGDGTNKGVEESKASSFSTSTSTGVAAAEEYSVYDLKDLKESCMGSNPLYGVRRWTESTRATGASPKISQASHDSKNSFLAFRKAENETSNKVSYTPTSVRSKFVLAMDNLSSFPPPPPSSSLPSSPTPTTSYIPVPFTIGDKVQLSTCYATQSDASSGPLKPGDVGEIIRVNSKCSSYQVAIPSSASSSSSSSSSSSICFSTHKIWWYSRKALVHWTANSDPEDYPAREAMRKWSTPSVESKVKTCGHECCLSDNLPNCCWCADVRSDKNYSRKYIDGVGWVDGQGNRMEGYCPTCRVDSGSRSSKATSAISTSTASSMSPSLTSVSSLTAKEVPTSASSIFSETKFNRDIVTNVPCSNYYVNWLDREGNVLFHFNPRPFEGELIMNSKYLDRCWEAEERIRLPKQVSSRRVPLEASVTVTADGYEVRFRGRLVHVYKHRVPLSRLAEVSQCPKGWTFRGIDEGAKLEELAAATITPPTTSTSTSSTSIAQSDQISTKKVNDMKLTKPIWMIQPRKDVHDLLAAAANPIPSSNENVVNNLLTEMSAAGGSDVCGVKTGDLTPPSIKDSRVRLFARFLEDVTFPEGSKIAPNTCFKKVWKVKNDGSADWPSTATLVFDEGALLCPRDLKVPVPLAKVGEEVQISITLIAPQSPGNYVAFFKFVTSPIEEEREKASSQFGHRLWLDIDVEEDEDSNDWQIVNVSSTNSSVSSKVRSDSESFSSDDEVITASSTVQVEETKESPTQTDSSRSISERPMLQTSHTQELDVKVDTSSLSSASASASILAHVHSEPLATVVPSSIPTTATPLLSPLDKSAVSTTAFPSFVLAHPNPCHNNTSSSPSSLSTNVPYTKSSKGRCFGPKPTSTTAPTSPFIFGGNSNSAVAATSQTNNCNNNSDLTIWAMELNYLFDMGFFDIDSNIRLLTKHLKMPSATSNNLSRLEPVIKELVDAMQAMQAMQDAMVGV